MKYQNQGIFCSSFSIDFTTSF